MILINGRESALVDAQEGALHYGDGVFETIAIDAGEPLALAQHLQRLFNGCERLSIPRPDAALLQEESHTLSREQGRGVLKWIISAGAGRGGYRRSEQAASTRILATFPRPDFPSHYASAGIEASVCEIRLAAQPLLAGIKHLNRLEQVLLRREIDAGGFAEGIVLDYQDKIIEGTRSNLFLVRDGQLLTPALEACGIVGVIREIILARAEEWGLIGKICSLGLEDLAQADEVFFCNSIMGVWPVHTVGERAFQVGLYSRMIREKLVAARFIAPD